MSELGKILERLQGCSACWAKIFFGALGLLCMANFFLGPEEPHFGYDALPLFWPVFGLGVGLIMVFVMKRIIQPLIVRKEDHYDDL